MHPPGVLELLALLLGILPAVLRSHADLVAENLLLRHQFAVVTRPGRKRPPLRVPDKLLWIVARRLARAGAATWSSSDRRRWSAGIGRPGNFSGAGRPAPASAGRA